MTSSSLTSYINEQQKRGIDLNNLKNYLKTQGYTAEQIEAAIKETSDKHKKQMIIVGSVFFFCIVFALLIFSTQIKQEKIDLLDNTGEEQLLQVENCPASCNDKNPCTQEECSAKTNFQCEYEPILDCESPPQLQKLQVKKTEEEETNTLQIKNTVEKKTSSDKLKEIIDISYADTQLAGEKCKELNSKTAKDQCFELLADLTKNKNLCSLVQNIEKKDICYFTYFLNTDDRLTCNQIINTLLKTSCETAPLKIDFILPSI